MPCFSLPEKGEPTGGSPQSFAFHPLWFPYIALMVHGVAQDTQPTGELLLGRRDREACWSRRKPSASSFSLILPPTIGRAQRSKRTKNKSVESKLYWPLNVPKVSSPRELGNKLAGNKVSLLPSSGRSCVYATSLASIVSRCGQPAFPATPVNSWYPS